MGVQTWVMDYPDRAALVADGWDFLAKTAALAARDTEVPANIKYGPGLTYEWEGTPQASASVARGRTLVSHGPPAVYGAAGDVVRRNLALNPINGSSTASLSPSRVDVTLDGDGVLLTIKNADAGSEAQRVTPETASGTVSTGEVISASVIVEPGSQISAGQVWRVRLQFLDAVGATLDTITGTSVDVSTGGGLLTVTGTASANSSRVRVLLGRSSGGVALGDEVHVEHLLIEKTSILGDYFDGDSDDTPGTGLTVDPAGTGELWGSTNTLNNILFHDIPADWEHITAKMRFTALGQYQHAGIMAYEHDNDYVLSMRNWTNNFSLRRDTSGNPFQTHGVANSVNPFWVRVVKLPSNMYGAQWSVDGVNFTQTDDEFNSFSEAPVRLGLYISGGGTTTADATIYEVSVSAPSIADPGDPAFTFALGDTPVSLAQGELEITGQIG